MHLGLQERQARRQRSFAYLRTPFQAFAFPAVREAPVYTTSALAAEIMKNVASNPAEGTLGDGSGKDSSLPVLSDVSLRCLLVRNLVVVTLG